MKANLDDDLDALFQLPLTEFTAARNALATRLKKAGRGDDAERVKELSKPSISAWAVNQLYWKHPDAFQQLLAAGERVAQAHASQLSGKSADTRAPLQERRESLSRLSRLAETLLRDAGHNPTPETIRRITTTLEALSAQSSQPNPAPPGRLVADVDPPGFESLAALFPAAVPVQRPARPSQVVPFPPSDKAEKRRALDEAELALREQRTIAQKASAALREMEKNRREAETRLEDATAAAEQARQHVKRVAADAEEAARALKEAELTVDKARKALKE